MTRNPKIFALIATAVASFGALGASSAQAIPEFHCQNLNCIIELKKDGVSKTAHHVFIVKKGTSAGIFTCEYLKGKATVSTVNGATTEVTLNENLEYSPANPKESTLGCSIGSEPVVVDFNGCDFRFTAAGEVTIIKCLTGKQIQLTVGAPVKCTVAVPGQGPLKSVKYHDAGTEKKEITVEVTLTKVAGEVGAGCKPYVGFESEKFTESEYTTGNTIVTGLEDGGPNDVKVWWE